MDKGKSAPQEKLLRNNGMDTENKMVFRKAEIKI